METLKDYSEHLFNFLNLHEQKLVYEYYKKSHQILFDGGDKDAEYKRAKISYQPIQIVDLKIVIFKIIYNTKYLKLTPRKILGNLMALGINRDLIGDTSDNHFVACEEIKDFLITNFRLIDNQPISLEIVDKMLYQNQELEIITISLSSLRIDAVIFKALKIKREEASQMVLNGFVKINQKYIKSSSILCGEYDIISIRNYGRINLLGIKGISKKGLIQLSLSIMH